MAPGTPNFISLLVILIYTSPPISIKIGPKLTMFAIGPAPLSAHFERFPPKGTSIPNFIKIGQQYDCFQLRLKEISKLCSTARHIGTAFQEEGTKSERN